MKNLTEKITASQNLGSIKRQTKARNIVADLLCSSALKNAPEFCFFKDNDSPLTEVQKKLRKIETPLQENPEILAFMIEFTKTYGKALKNDLNHKTNQNHDIQNGLNHLSNYLAEIKKNAENPKLVKVPDEYEIIIDAMYNQAAMGRLGPLNNVKRQIMHWAEHTAEELKEGAGIGKPLKSKLWRIPVASGLVGGVVALTIMMYANYKPPTTIKIDPIVTAYESPVFDDNGLLVFETITDEDNNISLETSFNANSEIKSLKLGCHSHIKAATFGSERLANLAVEHVFKDPKGYEDCIVIGETSQNYYERFDLPVYATRDAITDRIPDSRFKNAFNSSIDKTHILMKAGNNLENAVVHPLITQFHIASSFALVFGTLMSAYALAGLRNDNRTNHNQNSKAQRAGHIYANKLRYGFMAAGGTAAWMQTGELSFAGIISTIPGMITYSVGGLLAGDTAQWAINKIKHKDFINNVPVSEIQSSLSEFLDYEITDGASPWTNHINAKTITCTTLGLTALDGLLTGGQGTATLMGIGITSAIDIPYIFIEDIPIHIPFAIIGDAVGASAGLTVGGATGAYLLGKKLIHSDNEQNPPEL